MLYHNRRNYQMVMTGAGRVSDELGQPSMPWKHCCFKMEQQQLKSYGEGIAVSTPAVCNERGYFTSRAKPCVLHDSSSNSSSGRSGEANKVVREQQQLKSYGRGIAVVIPAIGTGGVTSSANVLR